MCPVSPSADDGDVAAPDGSAVDVDVAVVVSSSNIGGWRVAINSGVEPVSGVEACIVANRSIFGVEAAVMLHPEIKSRVRTVDANPILFVVRLNMFNMEFLTT